jgi:uncharacterized protein (TIGR03435 family)
MLSIGLMVTGTVGAFAQIAAISPRFEVASVRSGAIARGRISVFIDPGRVNYRAHTLKELIVRAYGLRSDQVTGPDWTETALYDVVATMPATTPKEQIPLMLQNTGRKV